MKGLNKRHLLVLLGVIFLVVGILMNVDGNDGTSFIYFGIGTWFASAVYYGTATVRQIVAFIIGLIVLHTGVLLMLKGELIYPMEFGFIMFVCGIFVLLNSGFSEFMNELSEFMKERKNKR